ncbi:hypothetical protein [Acrocarpospora macrocephala]
MSLLFEASSTVPPVEGLLVMPARAARSPFSVFSGTSGSNHGGSD